jgi:hypothetical protein
MEETEDALRRRAEVAPSAREDLALLAAADHLAWV